MLKNLFQQESLKEVLINKELLTEDDYNIIDQCTMNGMSDVTAVSKEFGDDQNINEALADYLGIELILLRELPRLSGNILKEVQHKIIINNHCFVFGYGETDDILKVAFTDPTEKEIQSTIELSTGKTVEPYYASWADIDAMILKYYGALETQIAVDEYTQTYGPAETSTSQNMQLDGDSPVVTVVNLLLEKAIKLKASDIHLEPFDSVLRVRYRIDGALVEQPPLSIQMHSPIIARLKVLGKMNIAERRIPQDGRITYIIAQTEYDIRVSMLPTVFGEKCVMRLALRSSLKRDKADLGLSEYDLKIFDKIFSNPNGIVLVTGPTGSGKSTTLYTALSELNTEEVNIVTVEDPVEANIEGINQVNINKQANLDFATVLRSILRQDPDIVMIGEIRDRETAEIAVQAALTGHLVVSTLHTNSSAATITRLINMDIEPYLVADSVVGIIAQRLVRRLCPKCKVEREATEEDLAELKLKKDTKLKIFDKCGCAYCNNTGYQGRIAVYEIMEINSQIKEMILKNATTAEIKRVAIANGMHTLHRSAVYLVANGITTISEMKKVSNES